MNKIKWIFVILIILLVIAGVAFYYVLNNREDTSFKENIAMPQAIAINEDNEINDPIVVKTIVMEIQKSTLEKATARDIEEITQSERAFTIRIVYQGDEEKSGRLSTIHVLQDGTFYTSKRVNGAERYVKGKFGKYTMDYLVGLYTLN